MNPKLLDVVAVYSNPMRWKSRLRLHLDFEQHMLDSGVRLTVVECAYGERPFELPENKNINRVSVRAKTILWNKENLINIGVSRLPSDWKYLCWCDADIEFRKPSWASDAVHALQIHDVIQPWSDAYDLGPQDEHIQSHKSFCRQFAEGFPVAPKGKNWWKFDNGPYDYPHCLPGDSFVVPGGQVLAASTRPFEGDLVVIRTASGKELSCTPNHPVLSGKSWVRADHLNIGDYVFRHIRGNGVLSEPDKQYTPTSIIDIVSSFKERTGAHRSTTVLPDDLDNNRSNCKIAEVWSNCFLSGEGYPSATQKFSDFGFGNVVVGKVPFFGSRAHAFFGKGFYFSQPPNVASSLANLDSLLGSSFFKHSGTDLRRDAGSLFSGIFRPSQLVGFSRSTEDTSFSEVVKGSRNIHANDTGRFCAALSGQIERDKIVYIGRRKFSGHVYDLKTEGGYIIANDIVTHNSGYAWCCTRNAFEWVGGLIDWAILGAGDHHMALGLVGEILKSIPHNKIEQAYLKPLLLWESRALHHINSNIGFTWGTIEHKFHGMKTARKYIERWEIILENKFNPETDIKRNSCGVYELCGNKPQLTREILQYFNQRNEDLNVLVGK